MFSAGSEEEGDEGSEETRDREVTPRVPYMYQGPFRTGVSWVWKTLVRCYIAPRNVCGKFQPVIAGCCVSAVDR